jgi:outer membrane protein assembly factor BamB
MQSRRTFLAVPAAFAFVDWPQWRGADHWPERLRQVWNIPVGEGHSSPVAVSKRVFQFARLQDDEVIASYDIDSGEQVWKQSYAAPHGKGPKSTPVIAGEFLYTLGTGGILNCWETSTGKKVWGYGQASSVVVDRGTLFAWTGPQNDGALTAFDAANGAIKWQWKANGPAYGSLAAGEFNGVRQIVTNTQNNIVGLSVIDGKPVWKLPLKTSDDQHSAAPAILEDAIIYSSLPNTIIAIRPGNPPQTLWENRDFGPNTSSPVLAAGTLWGLSNSGQFCGLDPKTGKTVFLSEGRHATHAALIARGSTVFALTADSELLVFKATPAALNQVAKYYVADTPAWAHRAIPGNRVLVKDAKSLALWSAE